MSIDEIRARMEACPRYCDMREHHERTCAVHYKSDVRTLLAENERLARENAELRGAMRAHDVGDSHLAADWLEARVAELEAQNAALAAALLAELDGANQDRVDALNRATSAEIRCGELESAAASATDLANSWARELGVPEAANESGLKGVIDRLWSAASVRIHQGICAKLELAEARKAGALIALRDAQQRCVPTRLEMGDPLVISRGELGAMYAQIERGEVKA